MVLGFSVRGNAAMARDRIGARVIGGKGKFGRAELRKHHQKVSCRSVQIGAPIMGIDVQLRCCRSHQLAKADRSNWAAGIGAIGAFNLDISLKQDLPIRNRQASAPQSAVPAISLRGFLNGREDFRAGDGAAGERRFRL